MAVHFIVKKAPVDQLLCRLGYFSVYTRNIDTPTTLYVSVKHILDGSNYFHQAVADYDNVNVFLRATTGYVYSTGDGDSIDYLYDSGNERWELTMPATMGSHDIEGGGFMFAVPGEPGEGGEYGPWPTWSANFQPQTTEVTVTCAGIQSGSFLASPYIITINTEYNTQTFNYPAGEYDLITSPQTFVYTYDWDTCETNEGGGGEG